MITIDGSKGEGGGQILRTSLALALVTKTPFRIERIRAGRGKPGLLAQHLAGVRAATAIGDAEVEGAKLGSTEITFRPRTIKGGAHTFAVGTAGSATLVFQTVFPALLLAPEPTDLVLEGGTHNPSSPPFPFLEAAFAPLLRRMGARFDLSLERAGFYPAGGGRFRARVEPTPDLGSLVLEERGAIRSARLRAVVCRVPEHVATREIEAFVVACGLEDVDAQPEVVKGPGPGNVLIATIEAENVTEVVTGFGERGVRAEDVAQKTAAEVRAWLDANVPVGEHLADQLVLPLAMGKGGSFVTGPPSMHLKTQIETVQRFLSREILVEELGEGRYRLVVPRR